MRPGASATDRVSRFGPVPVLPAGPAERRRVCHCASGHSTTYASGFPPCSAARVGLTIVDTQPEARWPEDAVVTHINTEHIMSADPKHPSHHAYTVVRSDADSKGYWLKIGAAWPHKSGDGFTIKLDALPLNGEIVLRLPSEADRNPR